MGLGDTGPTGGRGRRPRTSKHTSGSAVRLPVARTPSDVLHRDEDHPRGQSPQERTGSRARGHTRTTTRGRSRPAAASATAYTTAAAPTSCCSDETRSGDERRQSFRVRCKLPRVLSRTAGWGTPFAGIVDPVSGRNPPSALSRIPANDRRSGGVLNRAGGVLIAKSGVRPVGDPARCARGPSRRGQMLDPGRPSLARFCRLAPLPLAVVVRLLVPRTRLPIRVGMARGESCGDIGAAFPVHRAPPQRKVGDSSGGRKPGAWGETRVSPGSGAMLQPDTARLANPASGVDPLRSVMCDAGFDRNPRTNQGLCFSDADHPPQRRHHNQQRGPQPRTQPRTSAVFPGQAVGVSTNDSMVGVRPLAARSIARGVHDRVGCAGCRCRVDWRDAHHIADAAG